MEEGFLEEFLLEDEAYNDIDANFSSVVVDDGEKAFEKISLHFGKRLVEYRVTIQLVMNLPLTSKQKFRFGLEVLF